MTPPLSSHAFLENGLPVFTLGFHWSYKYRCCSKLSTGHPVLGRLPVTAESSLSQQRLLCRLPAPFSVVWVSLLCSRLASHFSHTKPSYCH